MRSSSNSKPGASSVAQTPPAGAGGARRLLQMAGAGVALLYFNFLFTYANVVSTLGVEVQPRLSLELVLGLATVALYSRWGYRLPMAGKCLAAFLIFAAAFVRYVDVTAPGVMGRDFNVHADLPHVGRVAGMFWEAFPLSTALLVSGVIVALSVVVLGLNTLAYSAVERLLTRPRARQAAFVLLAVTAVLWLVPRLSSTPTGRLFAPPVAAIVGKQIGYLRQAREIERLGFPSTAWSTDAAASDLGGLGGAHIYMVFLESYGATLIDDPHHYDGIAPRFERFARRLAENGFSFVSSKIISPTFAGGSWRAQATVLSGIRIANEHFYDTLLKSDRKTLVHLLNAAGYRTVTAEPGIQLAWPEGEFFQFDKIYDAAALEYTGHPIGWWKIPDQYTLYKVYKEEILPARRPVFAKIALIMSHIPYFPVPPYVEDWSRFDTGTAYSQGMPSIAADDYRDLGELSSRYVKAFIYELDILEDFIVELTPENSLVILCGDHQPPKLATHDNDSWAVPMQLISRRRDLVEPFREHGFRNGLVPHHPAELHMEDFLPAFLKAFRSSGLTAAGS